MKTLLIIKVSGFCRIVAKLYPATSEVLEAAENNRKMWALLNHKLLQQKLPRNMDMFRCNVDFDI